MESKIQNDLLEILDDDMIKVKIDDDFDIPEYTSKEKRKGKDKRILVLSGGGIKGIAHIGVLLALQELEILQNIEEFAGTSAGALVIAMYLIGYSPKELFEFLIKFELKKLLNINFSKFLQDHGLDDGKYLEYVLKRLIIAKGHKEDLTLRDLYLKTKKKFKFTTVCWNTKKAIYMDHENFANLPVWKALRMTSAIPFFYTKIKYNGLLYIDGGCIDNFPIQLYDDRLNEVIGIYLDEPDSFVQNPSNLEEDWYRIYEIFTKGVNFGCKKGYEKYTISINLDGVIPVEYTIDRHQKENIFSKGYDTIIKLYG